MSNFDGLPTLRSPIAVLAFAGWNDAGEASTGVIEHLEEEWKARPVAELDSDEYYDFQVNRPIVTLGENGESHSLEWPTTRISYCSPPGSASDLVLVNGIEPNMRWRAFCDELLDMLFSLNVELVVLIGALLSDVAHTRPVPITGSATNPGLMTRFTLEPSRYEGPIGIVGVLQEACRHADVEAISLWAQVPHYVGQSSSPKATLSLVHRLEDALDIRIGLGELAEEAAAWESAVNEAANSDAEMAEYVKSLEEREGAPNPRPPSGEELAKMFEKFLRRPGGTTE